LAGDFEAGRVVAYEPKTSLEQMLKSVIDDIKGRL
jgi:hypothetical protein